MKSPALACAAAPADVIAAGELRNLSALPEFESPMHIGDDRFNDTIDGKTRYPTAADPEHADANRAWLNLSAIPGVGIFRCVALRACRRGRRRSRDAVPEQSIPIAPGITPGAGAAP